MYLGRIVEMTDKTSLFEMPLHPYTEALLSAVPIPKDAREKPQAGDPDRRRAEPDQPAAGLPFPRPLPLRDGALPAIEAPALREVCPGHWPRATCTTAGVRFPLAQPGRDK